MTTALTKVRIVTEQPCQLVDITSHVTDYVSRSGVANGMVHVMTMHTSSGLLVTEGLSCIEEDTLRWLKQLAPKDEYYYHNRYLPEDGCMGYNADSHLKSILLGYFAYFPIADGTLIKGSRQTIYFAELDGPSTREFTIQVMGV